MDPTGSYSTFERGAMSMWVKAISATITVLSLQACTITHSQAPSVPFAGLSGTSWQLVEIQSMDDAQGITRPDDPSKYTLEFERDGSLSARLDCNRGKGNWNNFVANSSGGSLIFGPLAVTRALCPKPTLGERIEGHLPYVRSFIIRDGRMFMSLMADGGIIVWEQIE